MSATNASGRWATSFSFLFAGLVVWAARFMAVYLAAELICGRGWEDTTVVGIPVLPAVILVSAIAAIAADIWLVLIGIGGARDPDVKSTRRFVAFVGTTVAATSALAILWETLPNFLLPVCR